MMNTNTLSLAAPLLNEATGGIAKTATGRDSKKSVLTTNMKRVFVFIFLLGILQLLAATITVLDDEEDSKIEIALIATSTLANVGMLLLLVATVLQLEARETLREIMHSLNQQIGDIDIQINKLTSYNSTLKEETKTLGGVEVALSEIARAQKTDVDRIVELVKESRDISLNQMKCVAMMAKHNVTSLVLKAFDSSDSKTHLDESGLVYLCLAISDLEYGIDGDIFKDFVLDTDCSLIAVLKLVNRIVDDNIQNVGDVRNRNTSASIRMKLDYWKVPSSAAVMDRRRNLSAISNPIRSINSSMDYVLENYDY